MAAGVKNAWSEQEWAKAQELRASGLEYRQIAPLLGRTEKGIESKFSYEKMTEPQREHRRALIRSYRRNIPAKNVSKPAPRVVVSRVSTAALAERDARVLAPRTLTSMICGDPPPGFSALDRRRA